MMTQAFQTSGGAGGVLRTDTAIGSARDMEDQLCIQYKRFFDAVFP